MHIFSTCGTNTCSSLMMVCSGSLARHEAARRASSGLVVDGGESWMLSRCGGRGLSVVFAGVD